MSSFHQVTIGGYPSGGLTTDRKPMMLANEAFSTLENAYVWRERTKKRIGTDGMGQLSRIFTAASLGNSGASPWSFNLFTNQSIPEPNPQIKPGSVVINIGTYTFTDQGNGVLAQTGVITGATQANPGVITSANHHLTNGETVTINNVAGMTQLNGNTYTITVVNASHFSIGVDTTAYTAYSSGGTWISINATNFGTINYATGDISITTTAAGGTASTINFIYYPNLQSMGVLKQDVAISGIDQTIFFDTTYAYQFIGGQFEELVPGTTWTAPNNVNGTNTNFFWAANYQGASSSTRLFFATNNYINPSASLYDPIRYYTPPPTSTWTTLNPIIFIAAGPTNNYLFQALILIPYYGRLLALNTWEGTAVGPGTVTNFFSRCRFSQIGDPTAATAWRSDQFGKGGFLDAPTNEAIVGAAFFRNTLIVFFEYSTWQLRYIGEYGLPFIFERISSDFGGISTFSSIVFDQGVMTVSDRGIIQASAGGVSRLDDQIPETVFSFEIQNNSPDFVHGVRDFEKEVVYWNYLDSSVAQKFQVFPTSTLLFNYKNNTWAIFRDTISCFGTGQFQFGVTWDSLTTNWDGNAEWDDSDDQNYVDYVIAGNQQGYIQIYENQDVETPIDSPVIFAATLSIYAINLSVSPLTLTVINHNLANGEIIYLSNLIWSGTDPGISNQIYNVSVVDQNTITLGLWNGTNYGAVSSSSMSTYIGGGQITLLPKMNIVGKDFNPFQAQGNQFKLSYIDFQMDSNNQFPSIPAVTIQCYVNSYLGEQANTIPPATNQEVLNSSQNASFIQGAANTNPCQITSANHGLINGTVIQIANVQGMTQINTSVSMMSYVITVINANMFSLNGVDATGYGTYTPFTGIWNTVPALGQTYIPGSQYAWYRFYTTQFGQYLRVALTFDDALMNQLATHQVGMELNAMNFWFRLGGRLIN